ncbi:MAG: 2Fe-2S iron-sulfur cluster binding domain-containing protein [Anaerolineales bacterium]|nr:MAG: 2Fe-2S iron-sulfur cluster binding domain-containing protein [Anaerolineales bacterium]
MWEHYYTPTDLDQAIHILAERDAEARIIAGATDLMLELERGLRPRVKALIDLTRIPGLDQIRVDDEGWIHLGPLVTHNQCAESALIQDHAFALARACWEVGAPQIRNRGTIAGNLITASPANDSIPPLLALDAQITLRSTRGARSLPLSRFYLGVRKTVMEADEVLTDIRFRVGANRRRSAFIKLGLRRAQAISVVNAAVVLELEGEKIQSAAIALGSVSPIVVRATEAEQFLVGKHLNAEMLEQTAHLACKAASPIDDLRGSAVYRRQMVYACTLRALRSLVDGREREGFPEQPILLWGAERSQNSALSEGPVEHTHDGPIETRINGEIFRFTTGQRKSLLRLLREEAGLIGTKEGCAEGECGACTVFLDGMAVMACLVPAPRAQGAEIITIEGLAVGDQLHPVQQAFIEEGAVQCGYCTPGFIMSAAKLLEERMNPTRDEVAQAITGNLCRCTGYYKIITAIEKAAQVSHPRSN